jgi:hypothetical protein
MPSCMLGLVFGYRRSIAVEGEVDLETLQMGYYF